MALPINVNDLLHGKSVEWERLEFKAGWNPLDVLHSLCAFANDFHNLGGGYIVIGVAENGGHPVLPPVGIEPSRFDAIQKEILNLGYSAIQPAYHPIVVPCVVGRVSILVIWAPGGQTRPYKAKLSLARDDKDYGYFIRKQSSTVRAKGADEIELLSLAATVPFDDRCNQQARVEDLSRELIVDFLSGIGSELAAEAATLPLALLGRRMNIVGGSTEAPLPLNVGLLFFNEAPHRFFPATQIDVVLFPVDAGGDTFTEKIFRGPLQRMVREALDYIRRNCIADIVIKHPDRAEATRVNNFPFEAVEEAIVNAIYHRGYEEREPVEVRVYADELVVLSFPGPDRSVQIDQLRRGRAIARRYRNRRIGEFLKELDLTEGRSTGIPKILRAMKNNGSPQPEFETDDDHSYFLVRLPVHPQATDTESPDQTDHATGHETGHVTDHETDHVTDHETDHVTDHVTEQVSRLLSIIDGEHSRNDLQARLQLKHRVSFMNVYLLPAINAGLVEMTLPDKPKSTAQRYRLTGAGRQMKAALGANRKQSAKVKRPS
ncbi:ATPase AAA [Betaproteobacteria bacterium]|nr:ATPase AAA [Betaproteobacteria bacterium]